MQRLRSLFRSKTGRVALTLVALNEIRGLCVVMAFLVTTHGKLF